MMKVSKLGCEMFLVWLIGLILWAIGGGLSYFLIKKVIVPYNRYVFENSNELGVVVVTNWDEHVQFKKYEARKEVLETIIGLPVVVCWFVGMFMVGIPTMSFLLGI
ncbi:hypothetical protein PUR23_28990 [Methylorubrum populi]|uniref:hypothetical protein n=1 Tax=Methylorubrum populi TaxID=223967 RepID=UPI0031FA3BF2